MTPNEQLQAKQTLSFLATKEGCSTAQIRQRIQGCIDDAWDQAHTPGNQQALLNWQRLFPNGKKPTVEQFLAVTARSLRAGK